MLTSQNEITRFFGKIIVAAYSSYGVQFNRDSDDLAYQLTHLNASNDDPYAFQTNLVRSAWSDCSDGQDRFAAVSYEPSLTLFPAAVRRVLAKSADRPGRRAGHVPRPFAHPTQASLALGLVHAAPAGGRGCLPVSLRPRASYERNGAEMAQLSRGNFHVTGEPDEPLICASSSSGAELIDQDTLGDNNVLLPMVAAIFGGLAIIEWVR